MGLPHLLVRAAGYRWLALLMKTVGEFSDAATVVTRSLFSMLKLFLLEGKLIGVCSLLTSMQVLGSQPVRGDDSARWSNSSPSGGVAREREREGERGPVIRVISNEFGVVGGGLEHNDGNGSGTSRSGLL